MNSMEATELQQLEIVIQNGLQTFFDVGNALLTIREKRLYRAGGKYSTFEEYCRERWGMSRPRAYQLIDAAEAVNRLSTIVDITPANEAQARPLVGLPPDQQIQVWQQAIESAPAGKITAAHVQNVVDQHKNDFNYKRDTKSASHQDIYTPQGMDACQTPAYAIDPLLAYLTNFKRIWEPACGEGLLVDALQNCTQPRFDVIGSDILEGKNFFDFEPKHWDCIVTNPPYSIKFQWLARCYTLGKPFALLMPVETLGAKTAQDLFERYGVDVMLLDKRINFKMPKKGWEAGGAQFPTAWFTWKMNLPAQISFGKVKYE